MEKQQIVKSSINVQSFGLNKKKTRKEDFVQAQKISLQKCEENKNEQVSIDGKIQGQVEIQIQEEQQNYEQQKQEKENQQKTLKSKIIKFVSLLIGGSSLSTSIYFLVTEIIKNQ